MKKLIKVIAGLALAAFLGLVFFISVKIYRQSYYAPLPPALKLKEVPGMSLEHQHIHWNQQSSWGYNAFAYWAKYKLSPEAYDQLMEANGFPAPTEGWWGPVGDYGNDAEIPWWKPPGRASLKKWKIYTKPEREDQSPGILNCQYDGVELFYFRSSYAKGKDNIPRIEPWKPQVVQ
jgi:hypothetical protein